LTSHGTVAGLCTLSALLDAYSTIAGLARWFAASSGCSADRHQRIVLLALASVLPDIREGIDLTSPQDLPRVSQMTSMAVTPAARWLDNTIGKPDLIPTLNLTLTLTLARCTPLPQLGNIGLAVAAVVVLTRAARGTTLAPLRAYLWAAGGAFVTWRITSTTVRRLVRPLKVYDRFKW